jgi:lysophospholipase L1-like esterase
MKSRIASVAAAALAFVALAAVSSTEARAQVRMPTHVACVGDSITYGYLASAGKSYPSDLQGLFGSSVKVMNFGRNSATMLSTGDLPYINQTEYTSATTFVNTAPAGAVVDVIIMLGTNDSKSYNWAPTAGTTRAAQFMTDCAAMVDHFANLASHPVVYLALPPAIYTNTFGIDESVTSTQIDPIIQQVAQQKGMPIIDIHTPTLGHPEEFQDGVHPTDAGYMILAQLMHDGLLRAAGGAGGAGGGAGGAGGGAGGAGGAAGRGGSGGRGGAGGQAGGSAGGRGGAAGAAAGTGGGATGGAAGSIGTGGTTAAGGRGGAAGAVTGSGGGGEGGAAGSIASGGEGGGATAGAGTAGAGTPGAGGSGAAGATGGGNSSGCSCTQAGHPSSDLAAAALVLLAITRRRRAPTP